MLKAILLVATLGLASIVSSVAKAASTETMIKQEEVGAYFQNAQVSFIENLNRKEAERLLDRRLSILERISLKIIQHRLKRELRKTDRSGFLNSYINSEKGNKTRLILLVLLVLLIILFLILVSSALKGF